MWLFLCVVLGFALWYLIAQWKYYVVYWKLGGPRGLPLIGTFELLRTKNLLLYFQEQSKKYKCPYSMWVGPVFGVYINDPVHLERVLTSPICINKSNVFDVITEVLGEGLISSPNPIWSSHRKLLNPFMSQKNILSFMPIFEAESNNLVNKLTEFAGTNKSVKIYDMLQRCFLDISCQTTLGERFNILNNPEDETIKHYNKMMECLATMMFNPLYQLNKLVILFDKQFYITNKESFNYVRNYVGKIVNKFMDDSKPYSKEDTLKDAVEKPTELNFPTFINHTIHLLNKKLFSYDDMITEANHMIVAAYDTSSKTFHHALTLLAMNPEWQDKLYEEIKAVFPSNHSIITYEQVQNLPLADMIINETLRLLPVAPLLAKRVSEDFHLNDDIVLPKNTNIALDLYSIGRNPEYWGPNALQFNPYNFLPEAVASRHPYTFTPFSKGIRTCIGSRYAMLSLKMFMVKFFRHFRFTTSSKQEDLELVFSVVAKLKVEPKFEIHPRLD